jgi:GDP-D-mannose 3',5'-epimerase
MASKTALVLGAGGFIGSHMVKRLKREGYWVRGVDLEYPEYGQTQADDFMLCDLRHHFTVEKALSYAGVRMAGHTSPVALQFDKNFDEVYQFAADMGGAGYIFTGEHDADIMHNSATINLNVLDVLHNRFDPQESTRVFYSSSACMYPAYNQENPDDPRCSEDSAYPAAPDSEYGWEKLFSERLYLAYARNHQIPVRIARYHNIYGPEGTWRGGREKAPAAALRKALLAAHEPVVIWGDGKQTRSFLYIEDCINATRHLMESDFQGPVNIGSEEMVSINTLFDIAFKVAGTEFAKLEIVHDTTKPQGVRGRNSDNNLIRDRLGWNPLWSLHDGMYETCLWIREQIDKSDLNPNHYSFA